MNEISSAKELEFIGKENHDSFFGKNRNVCRFYFVIVQQLVKKISNQNQSFK